MGSSYDLNSGVLWTRLDELVQGNDYLYADSARFMQELLGDDFDPTILSFGEAKFQQAKIIPCLEKLAGSSWAASRIGVEVVARRKAEHLAETYRGHRGVLLDDVPRQNLPAGFIEIQIDRKRDLPQLLGNKALGGFVVSNLAQALQVIRSLHT